MADSARDYQDETKIIPQGLVEILEKIENKGKISSYLKGVLIEILGEERYQQSTINEIIADLKSIISLREKNELESDTLQKLEGLERKLEKREDEILKQKKEIEEKINQLKAQKTINLNDFRELNQQQKNLENLNIEEKEIITISQKTKPEEIKYQPQITTTKEPLKTEIKGEEITEGSEKTGTLAFEQLIGNIEEIEKKIENVKKIRQELETQAGELAKNQSEIIEKELGEMGITINLNDKENIQKKITESLVGQDIENISESIANEVITKYKLPIESQEIGQKIEIKLSAEAKNFIQNNATSLEQVEKGKILEEAIEFYRQNSEFKSENVADAVRYLRTVDDFFITSRFLKEETKIVRQNKELTPGEQRMVEANLKVFLIGLENKKLSSLMKNYGIIKNNLHGNIPLNNNNLMALDGFHNFYSRSAEFKKLLWQLRLQIFGGQNYFIGGFRSEDINFFLQNSFNFLSSGFNQSFLTGLKGSFKIGENIFSGKAKDLLSSLQIKAKLASGLKIGAKGLASGLKIGGGPVGWVLLAADLFKSFFSKLAEPEKVVNLFIIVFIVVLFGTTLMGCALTSEIIGPFTPITEWVLAQDIDLDSPVSCEDKSGYIEPKKNYQSDTSEKFTLWVFEPGSQGGRLTQKYDLEESAPLFSQQHIDPKYNTGTSNDKLDSRVIPAYEAMVRAGIASGQLSYPEKDLKLTSGYRNKAYQQKLWNEALIKYGSPEAARKYVSPPGCSPHQTGRAIDIYVNGSAGDPNVFSQQRLSKTFQWLSQNAPKYGFYNYPNEPWHWEYNPIDK